MKGQKENIQNKKGKMECSKHPSNLPKPEAHRGSHPSRLSHAQTRSFERHWVCFCLTRIGEPNHAQARSHLVQAQLG